MFNRQIARWSAIAMLACAPVAIHAQATQGTAEHFTFTVSNVPESTLHPKDGRFRITLNRWSTDDERSQLRTAFSENGAEKLHTAFGQVGPIGYLQWPGGLEYAVRYARRVPRADGTTDVVLVVDRGLWVWWDTKLAPSAVQAPVSVIQVRLGKDGRGEGRVAFGTGIGSDNDAGVALANFAQQPLLLTDVRLERTS